MSWASSPQQAVTREKQMTVQHGVRLRALGWRRMMRMMMKIQQFENTKHMNIQTYEQL